MATDLTQPGTTPTDAAAPSEKMLYHEKERREAEKVRDRVLGAHGGNSTTTKIEVKGGDGFVHYNRKTPNQWHLQIQNGFDIHNPDIVIAIIDANGGTVAAGFRSPQATEPLNGLKAIAEINAYLDRTHPNQNTTSTEFGPDDYDGISTARAELEGPRPVPAPEVNDYA